MSSWKNNTSTNSTDAATNQYSPERLESAQHNLFLARRRVLGAAVLLSLSFAFLPWVLDDVKRNWNEDVILRMPKEQISYKNKMVENVNSTPANVFNSVKKGVSE
ncbi:MAG: hypothetical protein RL344_1074 [Pseudomonadota bacterium]|jgi:hypothetical protein